MNRKEELIAATLEAARQESHTPATGQALDAALQRLKTEQRLPPQRSPLLSGALVLSGAALASAVAFCLWPRPTKVPAPVLANTAVASSPPPKQAAHRPTVSLRATLPPAPTPRTVDDLAFLNPHFAESVAPLPPDTFVTVPILPIASAENRGALTALGQAQQELAIVDTRLMRKLTLRAKAVSFTSLCERLTRETGITFTANRRIADDNVTLFCKNRPLREILRELVAHFGFEWRRTGEEGTYAYELTQSLQKQLLEETLRQQDRDAMLLEIDRQMQLFRPYLGLSREELGKKLAALTPRISSDKAAFAEWGRLNQLYQGGGLVPTNLFFRLSSNELDSLRSGQELRWELDKGNDLGLPPALLTNLAETFAESASFRGPSTQLATTLQLDTKTPGEFQLKGHLQRQDGGIGSSLAVAKSPAAEKIDNAAANQALARDPQLQGLLSLTPKPSCQLIRHPYPEFDTFEVGPKVRVADVLEALHDATGQDILADQFLRLYDLPRLTVTKKPLFGALNQLSDALRVRWSKAEGWLRFRTPDYYLARPQEVPLRLLERWALLRKEQHALSLQSLTEIGSLTDTQLNSPTTAQAAIGFFGLQEWPQARMEQARPHWRFLAQLPREQREAAFRPEGVAYKDLRPNHRALFLPLTERTLDPLEDLNLKDAGLQVLVGQETEKLLPANGVIFLYRYGKPATYSMIGPFNAIIGYSEAMLTQRRQR